MGRPEASHPSRSFEFLNAFELWGHIITYETEKPSGCPTARYYQVVRNQGKFNTKLPLERYPFDTQHLVMELEDTGLDTRDFVYVPDDDPVAISEGPDDPGLADRQADARDRRQQVRQSNFGDPACERPHLLPGGLRPAGDPAEGHLLGEAPAADAAGRAHRDRSRC